MGGQWKLEDHVGWLVGQEVDTTLREVQVCRGRMKNEATRGQQLMSAEGPAGLPSAHWTGIVQNSKGLSQLRSEIFD